MAGIAILLELLRKNPKFDPTQTPHCFGYLPAKVAISAAPAASVAATYPFGFRVFISNAGISVAHCDAAPAWITDPSIHNIPGYVFESDSLIYSSKVYNIEVKVPFSAFQWKMLAVTTLRSFLLNYWPLMVPRTNLENDGKCFLHDSSEEHHIDLVSPFKKSVKQIIHESTVVTTRRVLERLFLTNVSQRIAWKLPKDASRSAMCKSLRGMPTLVYL